MARRKQKRLRIAEKMSDFRFLLQRNDHKNSLNVSAADDDLRPWSEILLMSLFAQRVIEKINGAVFVF